MDTNLLEGFIGELLHINDVSDNKLIDLGAGGGKNTYLLTHTCIDRSAYSAYALKVIAARRGKPGNTILLKSAVNSGAEQHVSKHINTFEWSAYDGSTEIKALHAFISNARKELVLRGNNPLFLSVGALRWRISVTEGGKEVTKDILSPLIIFPVRLIVSANSSPVTIEFIDDDVYVNPCLIAKLEQIHGKELADEFPMPSGGAETDNISVDLSALGDGTEYFRAVTEYVASCRSYEGADDTLFEFDKDVIAIAQYNHSELCTYYDIRRNRKKINSHPLVEKLFSRSSAEEAKGDCGIIPKYVLPYDSVQADIITRVVNGESMIIKGPPGTGKTVTIANMIAALVSENKRVLFASKKISALNEVYAKLPEKLRKFAMLLDSETESKAAKINPAEVKQDFKRLLAACREYKPSASLEKDAAHAAAERAKILGQISSYVDLTFNNKCVAEDSFYAAMDAYCRIDMPVVRFADESRAARVTRAEYNKMYSAVTQASEYYQLITANGAHTVGQCPWFGIDGNCDVEKAMAHCAETGRISLYALGEVSSALAAFTADASAFSLRDILSAAQCTLPEKTVEELLGNAQAFELIDGLEQRLNDYLSACADRPDGGYPLERADSLQRTVAALNSLDCDGNLKLSEVELISKNSDVFVPDGKKFVGVDVFSTLVLISEEISSLSESKRKALDNSCTVFEGNLSAAQTELIFRYGKALSAYDKDSAKPKAVDFKAKKAYSSLSGLCFIKNPSFGEVVYATAEYLKAAKIQTEIEEKIQLIYRCFRRSLTEEQLACVLLVAAKCSPEQAEKYIKNVVSASALLCECAGAAGVQACGNTTVGELIKGYDCGYKRLLVGEELARIDELVPVLGGAATDKEIETARSLCSLKLFKNAWTGAGNAEKDVAAAISALRGMDKKAVSSIRDVVARLTRFGREFFKNYYSIRGAECTFAELEILAREADDRDVIGAAASYGAIRHDKRNALDLSEFFYPFEKGEITLPQGVTFADAFEHSFFGLAIEWVNKQLGVTRNGLGNYYESNLGKLGELEERVCGYNADMIEGRCLGRINPQDGDFIFVQDNNPNENLRLMFKKHGRGILKLKKCLILSPYTASLLFRTPEYDSFDVLIVDEASQLEPALILPVLFRSKQAVIVGDEWQMPPIKHFVSLSPTTGEEEEGYGSLEPEISALGLALRCEGFPVRELICHYRSKTESLIKFSQKLFYPNMRTFPAPVPARLPEKGVAGLGFKDVYVPEGYVERGVNVAEAERAVEELRAHFDNYYDEESHTLSMSVGVVAFGESQCAAIQSRVRADAVLYGKISSAIEHFDDLPEKLVFFKTIETVQGQEIGHLILSVTHGKRATGLHMSFGQLNQGKLGRCIFNVAVTRAQNMVTVIHSVRPQEITADSVSYIREYLETVERFCTLGREQFVSEQTDRGFLAEVADFICAQGVERERVVFNYGVTDGSVRIPVAVLSPDLKEALLGVWCEKPVGGKYDFLDYNLRYKANLERCGWKLHCVSIHDWVDNRQNEKKLLLNALKDIIMVKE